MASLSDKISMLTDPTPCVLDLEDDDIDAAKITKYSDDNDGTLFAKSELRNNASVLLDNYPEYAGKKVSQKSLDKFFHDDEKKISKYDKESDDLSSKTDEDLDSDENEEEDDDNEEEEEEELNDSDLENFKVSMKKQSRTSDDERSEDVEESDTEESDIESNDDLTNKFSNIDVTNEIEKGTAVKAQQEIWFRLCEARIKLQKVLLISNRLPQSDHWSILKKNMEKDMLQSINKGSNSVKYMLNNLLNLQSEIIDKNQEINNLNQETDKQSDEEIPSDTEDEIENQTEKSEVSVQKNLKRKLKCEEYGEIVAKRHKSLIPYRNSVISKWDEKTKLSSGRITQKSFKVFESSALKQIEQILQDETRLIKRTQLKRSLYKVLGKSDEIQPKEKTENESTSKQDMLLRDYDTEIFDDDDFYRQLLRDVIESKSVGIDPVVLRKQMEIQDIRNKIKKKVDTKASKGRKIRYDVHSKLVGFMKKISTTTLPDDARDNLLKRMFGKPYTGS